MAAAKEALTPVGLPGPISPDRPRPENPARMRNFLADAVAIADDHRTRPGFRRLLPVDPSPDCAAAIRRRLDAVRPGRSPEGSPEPTAVGEGRSSRAKGR
jgi:hypothetical protein